METQVKGQNKREYTMYSLCFVAPPVGLEPTKEHKLCYFYLNRNCVQSTPCSITVCARQINRRLQTVATAFLQHLLHLPPAAKVLQTTNFATLSWHSERLLTIWSWGESHRKKTKPKRVHKVLSFVLWLPLLGSNQRQRG